MLDLGMTEGTIVVFSVTEQLSHTARQATQPSVAKKNKNLRMVLFGIVQRLAPLHNSLDLISEPLWTWSHRENLKQRPWLFWQESPSPQLLPQREDEYNSKQRSY